jgi:hypothetical protein
MNVRTAVKLCATIGVSQLKTSSSDEEVDVAGDDVEDA